jgi:transcriptional regulator with XRE-family HTH domain
MSDVGKNIRKFRIQLNMTQEELAEKILSTRTTVSNYETGRSNPDIDMLVTICEVFDTSPDVLIVNFALTDCEFRTTGPLVLLNADRWFG